MPSKVGKRKHRALAAYKQRVKAKQRIKTAFSAL